MTIGAISSVGLTASVLTALDAVTHQFGSDAVELTADGFGGAFVIVSGVDPGPPWRQRETWLGFHVTHLHPAADVYPHYVRPDLVRADGASLGPGLAPVVWTHGNRQAMQVSRKSHRWNPAVDTPVLKAMKVLDWLAHQ